MDTTDVQLPEELNPLVEQIAKNVHEVWAQSRMEQGWVYGEERNDTLKTHPCLIPDSLRGTSRSGEGIRPRHCTWNVKTYQEIWI